MKNQLPDAASLVKEFDLLRRGRQNGSLNNPPATEPGLDPAEAEVEDRCHGHLKERLETYRREQDTLLGRMKLERREEDADAVAEEACQAMQSMIRTAKPDLEGHRERVEDCRSKIEILKEKYDLDGSEAPKMPESRLKFAGILLALIVLETMINGIFFGANLRGGLLGGMTYAAIISVVNVVALGAAGGLLVAWLFGRAHITDPQRLSGILCLLVVVTLGVLLNLGVAHYREALPADYPPAPDFVETASEAAVAASCWRGEDEIAAGREAICLFWNQWFVLNDFQSYVLMLIGLAMFAGAAWKWWGKQDPYPGFGRASQDRQRAEKALNSYVGDLLEELERRRMEAVQRLERLYRLADPIAFYDRASEAYDQLRKRHAELCEDAEYLQESCRRAIASYRSANRAAPRTEPEPDSWQAEWTANWKLPEAPDEPDIGSRPDAWRRATEAKSAKDTWIEKVNSGYKQCTTEVRKIVWIQDV